MVRNKPPSDPQAKDASSKSDADNAFWQEYCKGMIPSSKSHPHTAPLKETSTPAAQKEAWWQEFCKNVDPLKKPKGEFSRTPAPPQMNKDGYKAPRQIELPAVLDAAPKPLSVSRRQARRMQVESTLDLHGCTQRDAIVLLTRFIESSYQKRYRCVLVITGKGKPAPGILRNMVLAALVDPQLKPMVTGHAQATAKDGGAGALYVFLKAK